MSAPEKRPTRHLGQPLLTAVITNINDDFENEADLETSCCPACGYRHHHGCAADTPVGAILHRLAHCPGTQRATGRPVPSVDAYFILIVENKVQELLAEV